MGLRRRPAGDEIIHLSGRDQNEGNLNVKILKAMSPDESDEVYPGRMYHINESGAFEFLLNFTCGFNAL
jgi:hypothetical protein